jgi:hypothetical protein
MFERYTEAARRVIFFARYEASQFGSTTIEIEHLLLGLIREEKLLIRRFLPEPSALVNIREQIKAQMEIREKVSTSIDLPLSNECQRILAHAAEEAEQLKHPYIGVEHLLLGILREESSVAAKVLTGLGLDLKGVREEVARTPLPPPPEAPRYFRREFQPPIPGSISPVSGVVPDIETAKRIAEAVWLPRVSAEPGDHLEALIAELAFGVWIVTGSHTRNNIGTKLAAFIQKEDGRILRIHQERTDVQS